MEGLDKLRIATAKSNLKLANFAIVDDKINSVALSPQAIYTD
jgi:hypothetical protein